MFGRAKRGRKSAQAMDTATDSDGGESGDATVADKISPGSAKRKINAKGLEILSNGVVSMRSLDLNAQVPTKTRDAGSPTIFSARLTLSKAYTLITFIHGGKHMPVEKHRDETSRLVILHSTAPYCLSDESLKTIMDAEPDERSAYLIGLAKIAQQVIRPGRPRARTDCSLDSARGVFRAREWRVPRPHKPDQRSGTERRRFRTRERIASRPHGPGQRAREGCKEL